MKTVSEIGKQLVELCRQNKNLEAVRTLYSPDVVSIDAFADETMPARMQGLDAVLGKNEWWLANHDIHDGSVDGPYPHGDRFIVRFVIECTPKVGPMQGRCMRFDEAGLYTVRDGKIVQEEFFYEMPSLG